MMAVAFILGFLAGEAFIFFLGLCVMIKRDSTKKSQQDTQSGQQGK